MRAESDGTRCAPALLTSDTVRRDQDNVEALCAERDLRTPERFTPNAFYGFDQIIKTYAGIPLSAHLPFIVPHGVYLDYRYYWPTEQQANLPAVLAYPPYRRRIYESVTRKWVVPSCSPYVLAERLVPSDPPGRRQGTLYFPAHSTHHLSAPGNGFEQLAGALEHVEDGLRPVTVCVYWRDVQLGNHLPFTRRGFPVVSAGHMYDPAFTARLVHLLRMHEFASGNRLGSHAFYAVHSGCRYVAIGKDPDAPRTVDELRTAEPSAQYVQHRDPEAERWIQAALENFEGNEPGELERQREIADYFLGVQDLPTPKELSDQFARARRLDVFGFRIPQSEGSIWAVPTLATHLWSSARNWLARQLDG